MSKTAKRMGAFASAVSALLQVAYDTATAFQVDGLCKEDMKNLERAFGRLVGIIDYMIEAKELSGEAIFEARMAMRAELEANEMRGEDLPPPKRKPPEEPPP